MAFSKGVIPKRGEMVRLILTHVRPVGKEEVIPFDRALGRVSAAEVYGSNTLPNRPVCRFDGIAVRYADFEDGPPDTSAWQEGREFAYGNTGIALPEGFDTVIAIEDVTIGEAGIEVRAQPRFRGEMVNAIGENLREGERLLARGEVISPARVGLLAAGGVDSIRVFAKPRVGIIPTGDELTPPTAEVPPGKNVESNSYMIAAYLSQWGAEPCRYPIVRDDPQAMRAALEKALAENDAAIIIAGSSLGTKDFTIRVLEEMGEVIVPQLAHGPGRKSSLSMVAGKPVLGIAGPPLGAETTCDLYLAPFVSALRGLPPIELQRLEALADDAFRVHAVDFCERVHIYKAKDGFHVRAAFAHQTTRAQMQALANGNFYREAGTGCEAGERVTVELLRPIEYLPDRDRLSEILGEDVEPYV